MGYSSSDLLTAFTVSCLVYGLQQILTFSFKNQMVPLSFGLFGSFLGLFSLFFPRKLQYFVIWSYYSLLQTTGMSWYETTHIMSFYEVNFNWPTFFIVLVLSVLCYEIGKRMFLSKEVYPGLYRRGGFSLPRRKHRRGGFSLPAETKVSATVL